MAGMANQRFNFNPWEGVVDPDRPLYVGRDKAQMYIKFTQDPKTGAPTMDYGPRALTEAQLESFERGINVVRTHYMPHAKRNYDKRVTQLTDEVIREEVIRRMKEG